MISTVSIYGVNDSITPKDLVEISTKYPFVEWGLNLSSKEENKEYFSGNWLEDLKNQSDKLRLRGILQGRWECDMLDGNLSFKEERPDLWEIFQRIQIDIRKGYTNLIDTLCLIPDKEIILVSNNYQDVMGMQLNSFPLFLNTNSIYTKYCGYEVNENNINDIKFLENYFWISVKCFKNKNIDLLKIEKFLDKIENYITPDSWFRALLETNQMKRRFSLAV